MRRQAVIVAIVLSLFAAACGGSGSNGSGGTNTTSARTTGQVDTNAEVRIAAYEDDWPAGGTGAKAYHYMYTLNTTVYEPLIYLNADYTFKPGLAERWEILPDGKTTRFFRLSTGSRGWGWGDPR